jgi:uncharacterized protein YbbK (DUF523 family)
MKVLVSACLVGLKTRYNGVDNRNQNVINYLKKNNIDFYPLCAEQLGGLSTPREPCEIEYGFTAKDVIQGKAKIYGKSGKDVTESYINGCNLVIDFCKRFNITHAILQPRSPACGYPVVYDGQFKGNLKKGNGLLAQLLLDNGIEIIDDFITDDQLKPNQNLFSNSPEKIS